MKKIAQLRERWSHRRTVSTPPPSTTQIQNSPPVLVLPDEDTEPDAAENASFSARERGPQPAEKQKTLKALTYNSTSHISGNTAADDSLCKRCRGLQLVLFTKPNRGARFRDITCIPKSSVHDNCDLCLLFTGIFKAFLKANERQEFSLRIERLPIMSYLDVESRAFYLNIYLQDHVQLFPTFSHIEWMPLDFAQLTIPDRPDLELVRKSLKACRDHQACMPLLAGADILRVIDCRTRRLVVAEPDQKYICLSYVWGGGAVGDAEFDIVLPNVVPKTVEDAMFVAMNLDIPYLWVDRYCINQGNPHEKHNLIRIMDRIYDSAELTIIAVVGEDPTYGLPGIRGTPRERQITIPAGEHTFVAVEDVASQIKKSKWNTRGWTYQEMLLSRRRLAFAESQIYFQCRVTHCIESLSPSMTGPDSPLMNHHEAFPHHGIGHTILDLADRLREYYQRQLSFEADIVHAFSGVVSAFNNSNYFHHGATHFYGIIVLSNNEDIDLTRKSFLANLAWAISARYESGFMECIYTDTFPSWTWAAAKANRPGSRLLQSTNPRSDTHLSANDPLWFPDHIEVHVTHVSSGVMDMATFAHHEDDYTCFFPYIDLTSWVLECRLGPSYHSVRSPVVWNGIEDDSVCHTTVMYAIYLGSYDNDPVVKAYCAKGFLLVRQVEPGVFRRVGFWDITDVGNGVGAVWFDREELHLPLGLLMDALYLARQQVDANQNNTSGETTRGRWHKKTLRIV